VSESVFISPSGGFALNMNITTTARRVFIATILFCVLVMLAFIVFAVSSSTLKPRVIEHQTRISPNKQWKMKSHYDSESIIIIEVSDNAGQTWTIDTRASGRMRWSLSWLNDTTIALESSDIGPRRWVYKNGEFLAVD
jgi:hypothetical protein